MRERRRSEPPHVDMPAVLQERVEAALREIAALAERADARQRVDPCSAAGAITLLRDLRELGELGEGLEGLVTAWLVEDAQVAQGLLAEALGVDGSNVGRRARRHVEQLRALWGEPEA